MTFKQVILGMVFIGLFAGMLMAIQGATVAASPQIRWTAGAASSLATQGGNITPVNVSASQLTSKWTAFNGNVTGSVILGDGSANVYSWTYASAAGGEVCVSTNSAQTFASPTNATTANIDSAFNTTSSTDNASATFASLCPALTLDTGPMANFIAITHQGSSTFRTCAATSGGTAINNHFFCTNINGTPGTNYRGVGANFEIMAPAGASAGTTYYFYVELA